MKPKRIVRWIAIAIGVAIVALYLVLPAAVGVGAVLPGRETVGPPPDGFDEITLLTDDQVTLVGWYSPSTNGAAIILLHGAGGSRQGVRAQAEMLARHGYGVLALDLRGHGTSGGATNRLGWQSAPDVGAAIRFLQSRPEVRQIGGLGLSMGGEVLLGAVAEHPQLKAIVADGATRRCTEELLALPSERSLARNFTARVMYATVQALSGERPPRPLLDSMVEAKSSRFYLIAAGANSLEVSFNELFADTLAERATLWVAPEAPHTGAFDLYRAEYERRVIAFFDETLSGNPAAVDE